MPITPTAAQAKTISTPEPLAPPALPQVIEQSDVEFIHASAFEPTSIMDSYRKLLYIQPRPVERKTAALPLEVRPSVHLASSLQDVSSCMDAGKPEAARELVINICLSHKAFHFAVAEAIAQRDFQTAADYYERLAEACAEKDPKNEDLGDILGMQQVADQFMTLASNPASLGEEEFNELLTGHALLSGVYDFIAAEI